MSNLLPVTGEILFDKDIGSFFGATAYVRLQDVSMSDAPSRTISEQIIKNVNHDPNVPKHISFSLYPENYDLTGRYIVSIHIDVNGNGVLDVGDLINMESYPVLTHGYPNKVSVQVKQIR
jgi:uncharacterized lipoprotein YbaY